MIRLINRRGFLQTTCAVSLATLLKGWGTAKSQTPENPQASFKIEEVNPDSADWQLLVSVKNQVELVTAQLVLEFDKGLISQLTYAPGQGLPEMDTAVVLNTSRSNEKDYLILTANSFLAKPTEVIALSNLPDSDNYEPVWEINLGSKSNYTFPVAFNSNAEGVLPQGDAADVEVIFAADNITAVNRPSNLIPPTATLLRNYPNPFNSGTTIEYQLKKSSQVKLQVFDVTGRSIAILVDGYQQAGTYRIPWQGKAASGQYFYRLTTDELCVIKKMQMVR